MSINLVEPYLVPGFYIGVIGKQLCCEWYILAKDSVVERGVAIGVCDVRVGAPLQQESRALLLLAFYGLSVLGQET